MIDEDLLQDLASDLQKKYRKYSQVSIQANHFSSGNSDLKYCLYVAEVCTPTQEFSSFADLYAKYQQLMNNEVAND